MHFFRKVFICVLLSVTFAIFFYMVSSEPSIALLINKQNGNGIDPPNRTKDSRLHSDSRHVESSNSRGDLVSDINIQNLQEINKITNIQLALFSKRHKKLGSSKRKIKGEEKRGKKTEGEKSNRQKESNETPNQSELPDNLSSEDIRRKYKFRKPRDKDINKISSHNIGIEIATDPLSSSAECKSELTFLTVLVVSTPGAQERRQYIRDTWGYSYEDDVRLLKGVKPLKGEERKLRVRDMFKTVFVVGQAKDSSKMEKVHEEARLNGDIVFGDLIEDYKNLTMKTRLGLKWAFFDCNSAYVLKTDDDVFVNPVVLVEWLKDMPRNNLYTGWCNFNSPVVRNPGNKWYVSKQVYAPDRYPGYCLGGGYLLSNDVVGKVIAMSYGRDLFPMEDLYVGLMISEMREVKIQDEKKHFDLIYSGTSDDCFFNQLFLAHQVIGRRLVDHIKKARNALTICT